MPDLSTIVKYALSVGNKSGAIPPAPNGILKLKESIEGLPFELLTKGMSGILDQGKMLQGLQQIIQQMGGIQNLGGNYQQIIQQVTNGSITPDQIQQVFGGVTAMAAGLQSFISQTDLQDITSIAPGTTGANT